MGGIAITVVQLFLSWLCFPLKTVYVNGSELMVSNMFRSITIPISQVDAIDGPDFSTLKRVRVRLNSPSVFGTEIIFSPPFLRARQVAAYLRRQAGQPGPKL
jgi:hypothetical protein